MSSPSDFHGGDANTQYSQFDDERKADIFWLQLFFMRLMGQVPLQLPALGWLGPVLGKCFSAYCIMSSFHITVLFLKTTYDMLQHGELEEITDGLTLSIIYGFATFGSCYFVLKSKRLKQYFDDVNRQHRHHSMAGLTYVNANRSIMLAHNITKYWLLSCMSGVFGWGLAPLLMRVRILPLKCWYPFDPLVCAVFRAPVIYEVLYVIQLWCQCLMGFIFGNGSALFVSIVVIMLGQYDVLYCSLKNFDKHADILLGKDINKLRVIQDKLPSTAFDDELNQYVFSTEHVTDLSALAVANIKPRSTVKEALHDSFTECVQMHHFILESCDTLEELFNPYCLVKSLQITLQLCLLVFVGVAGEGTLMRTINLVQYLGLTLAELLMFTYCGELLRSHSVRAGEAFWRSQWWLNGHLIKRDIFIFLTNSSRVVTVTAGKFYIMDVQRLRMVITQAFSFLTLLQKLAEKN